jgi:hypothetical protein
LWILKRAVREIENINASARALFEAFLAQDARPCWSYTCDAYSLRICDVDFSRKCVMPTVLDSSYADDARFLFVFAKANGEMGLVTSLW